MPDQRADDAAGAEPLLAHGEQTFADGEAGAGDLAWGVNSRPHEFSRDMRELSAHERARIARTRLDAANKRDAIAQARDHAALARDRDADARDLAMTHLAAADEQEDGARALTGADVIMRAARQRKRAAQRRAQAAEQRALAAEDRRAAAQDREQAAGERLQALADREALTGELAVAATDPLTGARTRAVGLTDLGRELDRCRRTSGLLVLAYVKVVGLKTLNDTKGHGAGDELLKRVVAVITEHLRSYDVIVRIGGDEFVCAMSTMTLTDARRRFSAIATALGDTPDAGAIRTGFAELTSDEGAAELIARAHTELLTARRTSHERP